MPAKAIDEQRRNVHALGFTGLRLAFSRERDSRTVDDGSELPVSSDIGRRVERLVKTSARGEVADNTVNVWEAAFKRRLDGSV